MNNCLFKKILLKTIIIIIISTFIFLHDLVAAVYPWWYCHVVPFAGEPLFWPHADTTHPLGWGVFNMTPSQIYSIKWTNLNFSKIKNKYLNDWRYFQRVFFCYLKYCKQCCFITDQRTLNHTRQSVEDAYPHQIHIVGWKQTILWNRQIP